MRIIAHQCWFFEGDVHHINNEEEREGEHVSKLQLIGLVHCYAQADAVRKEVLRRPLAYANASVVKLEEALQRSCAVTDVADLQTGDTRSRGGLLSSEAIGQANSLLEILNGK